MTTGQACYGAITRENGSETGAHRISWEIANGRLLTRDEQVLHRCDNPNCVRPDHLFVGTHADNMADMRAKGRGNLRTETTIGERNQNAILTDSQVIEARRRFAEGESAAAMAVEYGVTYKHLIGVIRGYRRRVR